MLKKVEEWRAIDGFNGKYEVSDMGRVRTRLRGSGRWHILHDRWSKLNPGKNNGRYSCVAFTLGKRKMVKQFRVHRLVAAAFIANPLNKPEVNHINGDPTDNRVENLEWSTRAENQRHAIRTGLQRKPRGTEMDSGLRHHWVHRDGREFDGTVRMLVRAFPHERLDGAYLYKMVDPKYIHYHSLHGWRVADVELAA